MRLVWPPASSQRLVRQRDFCEGRGGEMAYSQLAQTRQVETPDGRRLHVEVAGDLERVVVVQVGWPSAGVLFDRWVEDAARRGLTLVTYDRPGYGKSSRQPGRKVADCALDVRAISQALGFDRCVVCGLSGGGPHALACAGLLDELVVAAATIGSGAPFDAPGFDWLVGMSDEVRNYYELFLSDRAAWRRQEEQECEELLALSVEEFAEAFAAGLSPGDRALALDDEFGAWVYRAVHAALAAGNEGSSDDGVAILSPWGFEIEQIKVPVKIWHGGDDRWVPLAHGRLLADTIPGAQAELRDDDGHLTVAAERIGDVHEWLAQYV